MVDTPIKASIFNIQRYSTQDGPGIRTTVFFKGCPLKCRWCCNPESQASAVELAHNNSLCIGCDKCVAVCLSRSIVVSGRTVTVDRKTCNSCGKCVTVCQAGALKLYGEAMSAQSVLDEVTRDALFYRNSGGGVTASGGEPLAQADFLRELFRQCKRSGLHTCLETSGLAPSKTFESIFKHVDLVYYDLKHMDSGVHSRVTGVGNELILANLALAASRGVKLVIRIPLVPGVNDSDDNLRRTTEYVRSLDGSTSIEIEILPYHRIGAGKYANLDRVYPLEGIPGLKAKSPTVTNATEIIERVGVKCRVEV